MATACQPLSLPSTSLLRSGRSALAGPSRRPLSAVRCSAVGEAVAEEAAVGTAEEPLLVSAIRGRKVERPPVWLMRQAGRYMKGLGGLLRVGAPSRRRRIHQDVDSFETELVETLATFIKLDASYRCSAASSEQELTEASERERRLTVIASHPLRDRASYDVQYSAASTVEMRVGGGGDGSVSSPGRAGETAAAKQVRFFIDSYVASPEADKQVAEELEALVAAREAGTAFILGHSHVQCKPGSSVLKRLAVDVGYNFLRRNCRGPDVALRVPPASLLEVGMVYVL